MLNRGRNIEKGRVITRRMFILAAAKILLFAGISSRLYNLEDMPAKSNIFAAARINILLVITLPFSMFLPLFNIFLF